MTTHTMLVLMLDRRHKQLEVLQKYVGLDAARAIVAKYNVLVLVLQLVKVVTFLTLDSESLVDEATTLMLTNLLYV